MPEWDNVEGKAKEVGGSVTGDGSREAEGKAQNAWGDMKDAGESAMDAAGGAADAAKSALDDATGRNDER